MKQVLFVHTASMMIVDEADLMLDMGFLADVDRIAGKMPADLQMFVFSATIPEMLKPFLKKYMDHPEFVQVKPEQPVASNIEHILIPSRHRDKTELLMNLLKVFNPYLALVFVNTKKTADELAGRLAEMGIKAGLIHGDLPARERKKMMKQIRNLDFNILLPPIWSSRGLDIEGVSHVINYELPADLNFYIHRSGRTGSWGYRNFGSHS